MHELRGRMELSCCLGYATKRAGMPRFRGIGLFAGMIQRESSFRTNTGSRKNLSTLVFQSKRFFLSWTTRPSRLCSGLKVDIRGELRHIANIQKLGWFRFRADLTFSQSAALNEAIP